jgi:cytidylate kinase
MTTPANHFYWDKLVNRQVAVWEAREHQRQLHPERMNSPCEFAYITISRAYGAMGYKIAETIGSYLNWSVYSRELVEYIAETANVRQRVAESFDERIRNKVESWITTMVDPSSMAHDDYYNHLVRVIVSVAEHGHCVIVGRGANYVLPPDHGLRIRLTAPLDFRVHMIAERQKISEKEAKKLVQRKDYERAAFVKQYFHVDIRDTDGYDMVINIANFSIEQAVQMICHGLRVRLNVGMPCPGSEDERIVEEEPDQEIEQVSN